MKSNFARITLVPRITTPRISWNKDQLQRVPARRDTLPRNLSDCVPQEIIQTIETDGKISFHAVGDTGAAEVNRSQTAAPIREATLCGTGAPHDLLLSYGCG